MSRLRGRIHDLVDVRKVKQILGVTLFLSVTLVTLAFVPRMLGNSRVNRDKAPFEAFLGRTIEELEQRHGEPMDAFVSPEEILIFPHYSDPEITEYHECSLYLGESGYLYILVDEDGFVEEVKRVGS